ncbi:Protein kinase C delta, partial [Pristimantis euphronides]
NKLRRILQHKKNSNRLKKCFKKKKDTSHSPRAASSCPALVFCGSSATPTISALRFCKILGKGAFGEVVLASVRRRNIYKAVKIIKKKRDKDAILQRERRILLVARSCPFLCHLDAVLQSERFVYFIMEHLSGGSLQDLVNVSIRLDIASVRFYTAELVCGLQFLHSHDIAHRDLKLDNIMLDGDGHVRIIDLGLASEVSNFTGAAGTLPYMAPEMIRGRRYSVAVDWWSLGVVVFRIATGDRPFYGNDRDQVSRFITSRKPTYPSWLQIGPRHLIENLLRRRPEKRLGIRGDHPIRDHPFFSGICWEDLEQRRAVPPFKPFPHALGMDRMDWPEDPPARHPLPDFSFVAASWTQ